MQFYWHLHHKILLEPCYDYEGRMVYVDKYKPAEERELRRRLCKKVEGELPAELIEAGQKHEEAGQKYNEAVQKYVEAGQKRDEAGQKREEAGQKFVEVRQKYNEAWHNYKSVIVKHSDYINKLHAEECPDCPWDGETIFPEKVK